jgi:hypothetical protein
MNASRLATLIALALAFVSCVAAVLVVPEVRCAMGLETSLQRQCAMRRASAQDVGEQFATPRDAPPVTDARAATAVAVLHIRARFDQVESAVEAGRLPSIRKEISGLRGDSAYATIYLSGSEIPKIRARIFENGNRTSYQAIYEGERLVFMFRTVDRLYPSGPQRLEEQRYYFDGGRMIRWLATPGGEVSSTTAEYVDAEQRIRALGGNLLDGARSPDGVIGL